VIIKGNDVDLYKLPIPIYCEKDVAPYLTAGVEIAKDPETGIHNSSIIRRMLIGKDRLSLALPPTRDIGMMITASEQKGQELGVATVIGAPPALTIASQIKVPMGVDESEIAGAFQGEPLEVIKCETIDVEVPANAEIIIESIVLLNERINDGPFGEYPGNYISLNSWVNSGNTPTQSAYVTKITAITMREDPIFQALLTGMPMTENHILKKWALIAAIYRTISNVVPCVEDIRGINLSPGGGGNYHAIISINKRAEATPRDIIYTVLAMRIVTGMVTVVDEDINIYNPTDVEWAVTTRAQPDRDIIILPVIQTAAGSPRPTAHMYRWGIDATKPVGKYSSLYNRAVPPGVEKVDYV
jgi:UbiD family decarboxylase